MYYRAHDDTYTTIECEKCGKVYKFENKYFALHDTYCIPNTPIKCKCGNTTSNTIYKKPESNKIKCPRCGSTQIQMVQRKWSPLTGFLTNKVDRVCVNCKHKF